MTDKDIIRKLEFEIKELEKLPSHDTNGTWYIMGVRRALAIANGKAEQRHSDGSNYE